MKMKILDDLLPTLHQKAIVRDVHVDPFQTAVATHNCEMASTPREYAHRQGGPPVKEAEILTGKNALELAIMAYSLSPLEAVIGMATINSLLEVNEKCCANLNAYDLLNEKGNGKKVALVGHFPFVPELRQTAKELWVIEQYPQKEDFAEYQAENLIPRAEVVGITGTASTNHTIEPLLMLCRPEAYVIIIGPTTPLSPVLFNFGVDAISGTKVVDAESVLRCVNQGATFRQIKGAKRQNAHHD